MPKKLDQANSNTKLLRLYITLISSPKKLSTSELTAKLNCSKQTVSRLVESINKELNNCISIETKGVTKYYSIEHYASGLYEPLELQGLALMLMCTDVANGILTEEERSLLNQTILKAKAYLPRADKNKNLDGHEISYIRKGFIRYDNFSEVIEKLRYCINNRVCCTIHYKKLQRTEPLEYTFAPHKILMFKDVLYVSGYIVEASGIACKKLYSTQTNFCVHRITDIRQLETSSQYLEYDDSQNGYFGMMKNEPLKVSIRFDGSVENYITDRIWSDDQKFEYLDDGSFILTLTVQSTPELISFVLSFGDKAEILFPETLRNEVKEAATKMISLYSDDKSPTKE
ncbi:MAG: helix-turn-helix transcriptional regulator [Succinivibrio sp.]